MVSLWPILICGDRCGRHHTASIKPQVDQSAWRCPVVAWCRAADGVGLRIALGPDARTARAQAGRGAPRRRGRGVEAAVRRLGGLARRRSGPQCRCGSAELQMPDAGRAATCAVGRRERQMRSERSGGCRRDTGDERRSLALSKSRLDTRPYQGCGVTIWRNSHSWSAFIFHNIPYANSTHGRAGLRIDACVAHTIDCASSQMNVAAHPIRPSCFRWDEIELP